MKSCFDLMLIALRFTYPHNNTYQPSGFWRKKKKTQLFFFSLLKGLGHNMHHLKAHCLEMT